MPSAIVDEILTYIVVRRSTCLPSATLDSAGANHCEQRATSMNPFSANTHKFNSAGSTRLWKRSSQRMGRAYKFLLINDTNTWITRRMARNDSDNFTINVGVSNPNPKSSVYPSIAYLVDQMSSLMETGRPFRDTYSPRTGLQARFKFGTDELTTYGWYSNFPHRGFHRGFHRLFPGPNARVYFSDARSQPKSRLAVP